MNRRFWTLLCLALHRGAGSSSGTTALRRLHHGHQGRRTVRPKAGFTLIELILVLAVGSMITLLSFQSMRRDHESVQARVVGQQIRSVGLAVDTYISERYTPISQLTNAAGTPADPGPRTCIGTTCTITVATLVNEGLLPATYQNLNSYGSGYTLTLTVSGTAPSWNVTGLVTTSAPWTTGGIVRYDLLGQAMAAAGSDSGMSRLSASRIDGYGGVWSAPVTTGSAQGLLGFQVGDGTGLYSVYLRRDGTLPMTGDLNLSDGTNHSVDNANNITGTGRFTSAQVYTSYENLSGNLDMSGTATIGGNANVSGNLGVSGATALGQTLNVGGNTTLNQALAVEGNATVNQGLTVGQNVQVNGSANVSNALTANTVLAQTSVQSNGTISAASTLSSGASITAAGNVTANGTVYGGYLQPTSVVGLGGGCVPGQFASSGGSPVQCKNGQWQPILGSISIVQSSPACGSSDAIAQCPANAYLVGGGYAIVSYSPICADAGVSTLSQNSDGSINFSPCGWVRASNAPDQSSPYSYTAWYVKAGGADGNSCFIGYAICASE